MIKTFTIGNLTNDVELKTDKDGKPYAILRIASDRRYRDHDGIACPTPRPAAAWNWA